LMANNESVKKKICLKNKTLFFIFTHLVDLTNHIIQG
jgi:hypothetical protein